MRNLGIWIIKGVWIGNMKNGFIENKDYIKLKRFLRNDFGLETKWDMPIIKKTIIKDKNPKFIPFNKIIIDGIDRKNVDKIVHFFIEDTNCL